MRERKFIRGFLVLFALLQAWATRFYIDPDGVNYLDAARAYLNHDWSLAFNGWWSPLYSWLLAATFAVVHSSPQTESTVLHLLNLIIFVASLFSFEFFMKIALDEKGETAGDERDGLSRRLLWLLGYASFAFSTLFLISVRLDTPDLCVACLTFLAAGLVLRIRSSTGNFGVFVALAAVLALAYFAKSVMFPLAFVFFFGAAWCRPFSAKRLISVFAAVILFLALTAPFVRLLSVRAGHMTFGEVGRIHYALYVDGVPDLVHWQTGGPGLGHPIHRMGMSTTNPPVYSYGQTFATTYPPWYDGSYWYAGVTPHFSWRGQLHALQPNLSFYYQMFSIRREFVVGFVALALLSASWGLVFAGILDEWVIWMPALVAFGLYALVYAESRYLGGFFTLLWMGIFLGLRRGCRDLPKRFASGIIVATSLMVGVTCVTSAIGDVAQIVRAKPNEQWEAAQALRGAGIFAGDRVGIIGHTTVADYWAHLAGLSISAEVTQEDAPAFWQAPAGERARILEEFRNAGARVLVTRMEPPSNESGWIRLGASPYYASFLGGPRFGPSAIEAQTSSGR
jgi:hypothetical protein